MSEMLRLDEIIDQLKAFAEGYAFNDKFEVINNWESSFIIMIPRTKRRVIPKTQTVLELEDSVLGGKITLEFRDSQTDKDIRQGALRR